MARWGGHGHKPTNWMVAVPTGDYLADSALLLHHWDEASFTWQRLPLARIIPAQTPESWPFPTSWTYAKAFELPTCRWHQLVHSPELVSRATKMF